jgi:hypothetical protein
MYFFAVFTRYHKYKARRFNVTMCCAAGLKRCIISHFKATSTATFDNKDHLQHQVEANKRNLQETLIHNSEQYNDVHH